MVILTPAACRAARALLGWSAKDLVREAGVSARTVSAVETGRAFGVEAEKKIKAAFSQRDVEITNEGGTGARIRFRNGPG